MDRADAFHAERLEIDAAVSDLARFVGLFAPETMRVEELGGDGIHGVEVRDLVPERFLQLVDLAVQDDIRILDN